jgi:cytochrome P450
MNAAQIQGHPILGHLQAFRHDRTGLQVRLAREHDLAEIRIGFVKALMVSAPAPAHEVLATSESSFVKGPGLSLFLRPLLGDGLLTSERGFHARQRKLLAPAFAHKRIASYADTMADRALRFAAKVGDGETLDVAEAMMKLTLEIVGKTLFDAEVGSDADAVAEAITTVMETALAQMGSLVPLPPFIPSPTNVKNRRAVARLDEIVYRVIRDRRALGVDRGDVLSMLLAAQDEDGARMTDKQVRDEAMTLFLAGHETTANALSWTLYLLSQNPEARARVEAEIDALGRTPSYDDLKALPYTLAAIKEAMRLYPPAYGVARRAIADVRIGGHPVRKNTLVLVNILGIHRRPDVFPDPEKFRPERFLGDAEKQLPRCAYLPFGAGPRICIGNHFALMESHVVLATMLARLCFDRDSEEPVALEPLVTLRPRGGLRMRATVRAPVT